MKVWNERFGELSQNSSSVAVRRLVRAMLIPFNDQGGTSEQRGGEERKNEQREEGRSERKGRVVGKRREHRERNTERKVERMGRDRRREGEVEVIRGKARQGELGPTCNYPV